MTNDRFTAELRQHLLTTAEERPGAGQLAAVAAGVARTGQRHALVARLTWFPGRIGPFPSAALRFSLVALALLVAAMASAILSGGAPHATTTSQSPSASSGPSPRSGEATFTSTLNGISIDVPAGWQTRPATEPWTGGAVSFDSPAADVIFEPVHGDGLYLLIASQPYGSLTADQWRDGVLAWTCADGGHEMWGWHIDGFYSWQQGPCNSGSIVQTATRGYLIRLVASSAEPGLADTYSWDWLKPELETVHLRP